jgi:peptidase M28-like protein
MRGAALAILILSLCGFSAAQKLHFSPAGKADVLQRTKNAPRTNQQRAAQLWTWFHDAGCGDSLLSQQKVSGSDAPNIICHMRGRSEDTIIIGAHYDRPSSTARPIDNWNSALLLPSLYQCLRSRRRRHTMIFVAFADNDNELTGAEMYVNSIIPAELSQVSAMINLDALGLSPTKVWSAHSDKELVQALVTMVYVMKLPASQINIAAAGKTDSEPFLSLKIPQITIHSMTHANLVEGTATAFRAGNYYDSYRLICGYLAYLDETRKPRAH